MGGKIANFSTKETRRVELGFGIGYDDDLRKAKEILNDIVSNDERILKDQAVLVAIDELGDSSVNFEVRVWVETPEYWDVYRGLLEAVKPRFDEEGITTPFPQRDVHLHQVAAA
jgi:small conductance mechanosensitive channel